MKKEKISVEQKKVVKSIDKKNKKIKQKINKEGKENKDNQIKPEEKKKLLTTFDLFSNYFDSYSETYNALINRKEQKIKYVFALKQQNYQVFDEKEQEKEALKFETLMDSIKEDNFHILDHEGPVRFKELEDSKFNFLEENEKKLDGFQKSFLQGEINFLSSLNNNLLNSVVMRFIIFEKELSKGESLSEKVIQKYYESYKKLFKSANIELNKDNEIITAALTTYFRANGGENYENYIYSVIEGVGDE